MWCLRRHCPSCRLTERPLLPRLRKHDHGSAAKCPQTASLRLAMTLAARTTQHRWREHDPGLPSMHM